MPSQNGTDTTYTYTYDPNNGTPIFLGLVVSITNMSVAADNGIFTVTGLGNGTFTVSNPTGQTASRARTRPEWASLPGRTQCSC